MDIPLTTIILMNPNGTIQIGTQPWFKGKKVMKCYQCQSNIVFEGKYNQIKCTKCNTVNQVPVIQ
ncbi:unnamed protein product [Paramecium octaurelia]|uniref:Uncharacterized protein n=1 Tax=Paramecium octaurelia TaxID=43137 RepID=A0A8S1YE85_PAROT|nr:unnamed protein product [Paramecium octaurelia]